MTDWQYPVVAASKALLKAISGINKVGEYPEDLALNSGSIVVALVGDGDEEYTVKTGGQMDVDMALSIYLYVPKKKGYGISKALEMQNDVVNAMLASLTLGGYVSNIKLTSVRKGEIANDPNNAGYSEQVYCREIVFTVMKIVSRT